MAYVSPRTSGNQELRQCLSYFLPVYCYSSSANQTRLRKVCLQHISMFSSGWELMIYVDVYVIIWVIHRRAGYWGLSGNDRNITLRLVTGGLDRPTEKHVCGSIFCCNFFGLTWRRAAEADQAVHVDLAIDILKDLMGKKFNRMCYYCLGFVSWPSSRGEPKDLSSTFGKAILPAGGGRCEDPNCEAPR